MSLHQSIHSREPSAGPQRTNRKAFASVAPRGFLGEVAVVAVAVIALTFNVKIISWLSHGSVKK
ncbi:MAG: hypothetical protein ACYDB2_03085 [Acidimicrobiales bacterium]